MEIVDIKGGLRDARVQAVISQSVYLPTDEKLNQLVDAYESDADVVAFAGIENGLPCGVLILKRAGEGEFEILRVATHPAHRGQGIAANLISFAERVMPIETVTAETDADAVGFYRKCGFQIESLGEKYPDTVRYLCTKGKQSAAVLRSKCEKPVMVRKAAAPDARAIGAVYRRSWQAAYRNLVPDAFLDALTDENCAPNAVDPGRNLVAEREGAVVGVVSFGPARDAAFEDWGELRAIYVLPDAWGTGCGVALFSGAAQALREMGYEKIYLWVLAGNLRARKFYEKAGMRESGAARSVEIGGSSVGEVRYELRFPTR